AHKVTVGVFGFDAPHGWGDGFLLDFPHSRVALVDGVAEVDGIHVGTVLKYPLHPETARGFLSLAGVLAREVAVRPSAPRGVGPAHRRRVGDARAPAAAAGTVATVVRPVDPHPSPPNAGTQCRPHPFSRTDRGYFRFSAA